MASIVSMESLSEPEPERENNNEDEEEAAALLKFGASTSPKPSPRVLSPPSAMPDINLCGDHAETVGDDDISAVSFSLA